MILINNICIVLLVIYLVFTLFTRLVEYIIYQEVEDTPRSIILIMYALSVGAIVSRLCIWLF